MYYSNNCKICVFMGPLRVVKGKSKIFKSKIVKIMLLENYWRHPTQNTLRNTQQLDFLLTSSYSTLLTLNIFWVELGNYCNLNFSGSTKIKVIVDCVWAVDVCI